MSIFILIIATTLGLAGLYFLLAVGLSLIFGLMDVLNLAHGAMFAFGGYMGITLMQTLTFVEDLTLRFVLAFIGAGIIGFAVGVLIEKVLIARSYGNHLAQILVTIGLGFVIVAVLRSVYGSSLLSIPQPEWFKQTVGIFGAFVPVSRLLVPAVALVLLIVLVSFLRFTKHGLIIRAGAENRAMVRALGIDVGRSFTLVFGIGSLLAAVGGVLAVVYFGGATPEMGTTQLIFAFIVVVIGGMGSIGGTAVSALVVATVQQLFNIYTLPGMGDIAVVVLLVLVLLLRPQGLLGRATA